jgi:dihydroorotate dehydrogenase
VSWGRDRDNETHLKELVARIVDETSLPLFVKLPPFVTTTERDVVLALGKLARDLGATGLTCANARPVGEPRLASGRGGLSGRALWPETARVVAAVREAVGDELVVHACGGVSTPADVLACLRESAATVQIYTALVYEGPGVVGALADGVAAMLRDEGLVISDLVGTADRG